ncbi:MAG: EAL domain-containing protein, partial [Burkholderiales bacterium]|nr:EAL domain-containing protein [Burkholderiales bacterium]
DNGQLVLPMAFVPAAERYNLMQGIDRKIVSMAFEAHGNRYRYVDIDLTPSLSLNLSGATMGDETFAQFVREQFSRHQIPPQIICFEVTETAAIANLSGAAMLIKELREIGCRFSLDDFGSGLSSFAYLKGLPVDYLKIDGAFVKNMASDPIDCAMVQAINDIGHVMGIETIAECVENQFTLDMLKRMGIDHAQGFGVERPRLFEVFESDIKDWSQASEPDAISAARPRESIAFFAPTPPFPGLVKH